MNQIFDSIQAMCRAQARFDSPLGTLLLARSQNGLIGAWFDGQKHHPGSLAAPHRRDDALLRRAMKQLDAYFGGRSVHFDLPLELFGTAFQRSVWHALLRIEHGATCAYADVARTIGAPAAARAVGAAVGRNPLSVIIPCHRVLGTGGALTGYAGGLERKLALLELERTRRRTLQPLEAVA
jgi:methylated-DNA-[protein]-cysteine S-methyltransferase